MSSNICKKIYGPTTIGHYGGLYVEVPQEHFEEFKAAFPSRQFPKRVRKKNIAKTRGVEAEAKFHKKYPKSHGRYFDIYFGDKSKGLKTLETMIDRCPRPEKARVRGWER